MARKKEPDLQDRNRSRIIEVAKDLFQNQGLENTKMEDIAKAAAMSKSTLYVYFKNRDEVVWYMSLEAMQYLRDELQSGTMAASMSFREKYFMIGHVFERMKDRYPLSFRLVSSPINVDDIALKNNPVLMDIFKVGEQINQLIYNCFDKLNDIMNPGQLFRFVFRQWGCIYGVIELTWNKQEYLNKCTGMTRREYLDDAFGEMFRELELMYLKTGIK